jgi:hypothetical protein
MKQLALGCVATALVLSITALSFAQAPMGTPAAAMPGKGEMKGETKGEMPGGMKAEEKMTKEQPDMKPMEKSGTMMEKPPAGMEKKSEGMMMEKKNP